MACGFVVGTVAFKTEILKKLVSVKTRDLKRNEETVEKM